jgi:uncharacterized protein (TIGR02145 family)
MINSFYLIDMKKKNRIWIYTLIIMGVFIMLTNSCKKDDDNPNSVTDIDGNVYHQVTIGTQVWMIENLKVTHYRNGDPISKITDDLEWSYLTTGAYCDYDNTKGNSTTYGKLYNFYAVADSRNLCPDGWHLPSDAEWKELEVFLGISQSDTDITGWRGTDQGTQLKATTGWSGDGNGTNTSGFTALPGGYRKDGGAFYGIGFDSGWWTATEISPSIVWARHLLFDFGNVGRYGDHKEFGFSVRCIKD